MNTRLFESDQNQRLIEASQTGNVQVLHQLITRNRHLLDCVSLASGENPLHFASVAGHVDFVTEIVRLKPAFAEELNLDGFSPMHLASANGYVQIVRELLTVDPELSRRKGRDQWTPLHYAVGRGRIDTMRAMVMACPESVGDVTLQGETAFHLGVKNSQFEAIRALVELVRELDRLDILNVQDNLGNSVLHLATWKKQHQVVEWLVANGTTATGASELNKVNQSGLTALDLLLIFPSEAGDRETEEILRGAGALRAREIVHSTSEVPSLSPNHNQIALGSEQEQPNNVAVIALDIVHSSSDVPSSEIPQEDPNNVPLRELNVVHSNEGVSHQPTASDNHPRHPDNLVEFFRFQFDRDKPDEARTALLVVAVLVATATYDLALNPPGGLWADTNLSKNGTEPPHLAGTSNIASYYPAYTIFAAVCNSIGFSMALHMINVLTTNFPLRLELQLCGIAMYLTYINGLITISPGETAGWYSLFALTPAMPTVVLFVARPIKKLVNNLTKSLLNRMHRHQGESSAI